MHRGMFLETSSGTSLGPGHFIRVLEEATGKPAEIVGKPDAKFFKSAVDSGIAACEVVMIGDDYRDDVLGAEAAGIHGILVKTGKFKAGQDAHVPNCFDDISAAVHAIIRQGSKFAKLQKSYLKMVAN